MVKNRVIHSMPVLVLAKTEGRYIVKPFDSDRIELIPVEKFNKCIFPNNMLDANGLLKDGVTIQCVRVANGWIYPNHKIYTPK